MRPAQKLIPFLRLCVTSEVPSRAVAGVLEPVIEDLGFRYRAIERWRNVARSSFDLTNDWLCCEESRHKLLIDSLWRRYLVNQPLTYRLSRQASQAVK